MKKNPRYLRRTTGRRRYKRVFVIATEGDKTEPGYFSMLNGLTDDVHIKCISSNKASSPDKVLKKLKKHLKENPLSAGDESWLVIDKDNWTNEQIEPLLQWVSE